MEDSARKVAYTKMCVLGFILCECKEMNKGWNFKI